MNNCSESFFKIDIKKTPLVLHNMEKIEFKKKIDSKKINISFKGSNKNISIIKYYKDVARF